jgi:hypothetical protein
MNYTTPIQSTEDAEGFLFQLVQHGRHFHPEDDAQDIINGATGEPLFTYAEAEQVNNRMYEVYTFMADPCAYLLDLTTSTDRS